MTTAPSIDHALPPVLQRDGACLREGVARRHGRWRNPARTTPRSSLRTTTNQPRHNAQRWVEKVGRSIKGSDTPQIAAIHRALEQGVNWIDTAAAYGFGHSEQIVGRALDGLTERPYVFTKCSLLEGPNRTVVHSLKRDSILRQAEASLTRLRVDAIDLYQIHWPIPEEDIEDGWATLTELKDQGLVRHLGVSNHDIEQLRRIQQIAPVETLQPEYSLIERGIEREILPYTEREPIGVIVYSPMGSGMLTGGMTRERMEHMPRDDWRKHDPRFNEPQLSRNVDIVKRLNAVADRHDTTPGAIAVAWTLRHPAVDGAIVGFRRPDQVDPILPAASIDLTNQDIAEIEGSIR